MLGWFLTGGAVPLMLAVCGLFFALYLGGKPFVCPKKMLAALKAPKATKGTSPFRAVMLALAGTLGVGNIVGVANAIAVGGAGAIFWMWVAALLAMLLKYCEIVLAVLHRRTLANNRHIGGACYYIKDELQRRRLPRLAALLSAAFAVLTVLNALSMGCVIQSNAIGSSLQGVFSLPPMVCGIVLVLLTMPVVLRGGRGVSALTEVLVPIMSLGYFILSAAVLLLRREQLGAAFCAIFEGAFHPKSAVGGIGGFLLSKTLRLGSMRGLLSNEGGCGTAPTAHAQADTDSAAGQGVWGIFEVFADTIVLCTVTALVLLVSLPQVEMLGENSVMMTLRAYSTVLGAWSERFLCAGIFCFGYATLLCWASYGLEALTFLGTRRGWKRAYLLLFASLTVVGACCMPSFVWAGTDAVLAAMTAMNLGALLLMRREIKTATVLYFGKKGKKERDDVRFFS